MHHRVAPLVFLTLATTAAASPVVGPTTGTSDPSRGGWVSWTNGTSSPATPGWISWHATTANPNATGSSWDSPFLVSVENVGTKLPWISPAPTTVPVPAPGATSTTTQGASGLLRTLTNGKAWESLGLFPLLDPLGTGSLGSSRTATVSTGRAVPATGSNRWTHAPVVAAPELLNVGPGDPVPVPEPASLAILGAGLVGLAVHRRLRRERRGFRCLEAARF